MSKPRKLLIAANWKMNPSPLSGATPGQAPAFEAHAAVDVVVFPTFLDIAAAVKGGLTTGGQWGHPKPEGAFTGDVSMAMLKKAGCRYVLCGHSDRRRFHHESDMFIAEQAIAALEIGLHPIVCIGETEDEHDAGKTKAVLERQLKPLPHGEITLAYEPVWAISRGDPNKPAATPADAQAAHMFIRSCLPKDARTKTCILYGGSMKADNAHELLKQPDIDGGLVGGASLKPAEFLKIVEAAMEMVH